MLRVTAFTAAAVAALVSAPLAAQDAPPSPAQQTAPTPEQFETAARHYGFIAGALQSDEVEDSVKNQLFACLYSASMRRISEATTQLIAENEQLDPANQQHVQAAIGAVCGVEAPAGAAPATGSTDQPQGAPAPADQPEGR